MTHSTSRRAAAFAALAILLGPLGSAAESDSREPGSNFDRDFSRTVTYKGAGQRLEIEHSQGTLRIRTHTLPEVRIRAKITVASSSNVDAQEFGKDIEISVEDTPTAVVVRTRYPELHSIRGNFSYAVDMDVTMPETMELSARNRFGDLGVAGLKAAAVLVNANGQLTFSDGMGKQRLENAFGAITVERNAGDVEIAGSNGAIVANSVVGALQVRNRFGGVQARQTKGAVTINASNGDVLVDSAGGAATVTSSFGRVEIHGAGGGVEVRNSNGAIRVGDVRGSVDLRTSFGEVEASGIPGDATIADDNGSVTLNGVGGKADVRNSFGKISVTQARNGVTAVGNNSAVSVSDVTGAASVRTTFGLVEANRIDGDLMVDDSNGAVRASAIKGSAKVTTSFGPVELDGVGGRIDVDNQNGSIDVRLAQGAKCSPVTLKSSFGPIHISMPEDSTFTVNAHTSFGKITTQLPLMTAGSPSSDTLTGRLGDGRCPMTLENSNGNIELRKGPGGGPAH
jgi:DUF4097 and DUF4098 domain-containing protein YvlB